MRRFVLPVTSAILLAACASKPEAPGAFMSADTNHDGYISLNEWQLRGGRDVSFLAIDRERKGRLSEAQFYEAVRFEEQSRYDSESQRQAMDGDIARRVKDALSATNDLNAWSIQVDSFQGTVQLSGNVRTVKEKERAQGIASGISGVKQVFNNITVKQ